MKLSIGDKFPINIYSEAALAFRDNEVMLVLNWAGIKSNEVKNVKSGLPQKENGRRKIFCTVARKSRRNNCSKKRCGK